MPYGGRVFGADELRNLVDASLEFWLTHGRYAARFEREFAELLGVRALPARELGLVGQPAGLHGAHQRPPRRAPRAPGDEVITVAAGFPTTVAPIVQYGAVPVFVDVELGTANIARRAARAALGPRTKAVFLAHTLGNPSTSRRCWRSAGPTTCG